MLEVMGDMKARGGCGGDLNKKNKIVFRERNPQDLYLCSTGKQINKGERPKIV